MKSESPGSLPSSRLPTGPPTPDTTSLVEGATTNNSVEWTSATSMSTELDTVGKGKKDSGRGEGEERTEKGSNLVGRITNLISTDLENIINGRDFPMLLISLPLRLALSILFLYKLLGWSAIAGMMTMVAFYPILGWLASKMQDIQSEKMKIVSHPSPVHAEWPCLIRGFYFRRTRVFRSLLRS